MDHHRASYATSAGHVGVFFDHEPEDREIQGQDCYADATRVSVERVTKAAYDARFDRIRVMAFRKLVTA